ncbi:tetratricopeptide repeat protein [Pseudofrankia saprophytica]|uniref:tetratricopeptide repeat protein n=1 Tax=Pseudofrankia saprophytica TaxID=298655 RepID=UPI000234D800|nr:tetratricopeptide repeat protein [Pseudofrankia saprophytica]
MDFAEPPPRGPTIDRRGFVHLLLAGAGAGLGGGLVREPLDGPSLILESVTRTVNALATGYSSTDPRRIGTALNHAERNITKLVTGRPSPTQMRDTKAVYSRLLTISSAVADDTGDYDEAIRTGELAASLATEVGDAQTSGYAWSIVSGALHHSGRHRKAVDIAQRAKSTAGASPSGVMALLEEATAAAAMGRAHTTIDAVMAAEEQHGKLSDAAWGNPGFGLLGTYHPSNLKAFAGSALVEVGLFDEATPRLEEAADILAGSPAAGIRAYVWVYQARAALGQGDVDKAHAVASKAVAMADARPTAFIAGSVVQLDLMAGGEFSDLVDRVRPWGFSPPSTV